MTRNKFTPEEEAILLNASAHPADRASAIDCMISDELRLHEALVISLLDHSSEHLRAATLHAVVDWNPSAYLGLLGDRMLKDPSPFVRSSAAITANWVGMTQPAIREAVLRLLAQTVDTDEDNHVSCVAYESLVTIATNGRRRMVIEDEAFDRTRDVDVELIGPYRGSSPGQGQRS